MVTKIMKEKIPYYAYVMEYRPKEVVAPHYEDKSRLVVYERITDEGVNPAYYKHRDNEFITLDKLVRLISSSKDPMLRFEKNEDGGK